MIYLPVRQLRRFSFGWEKVGSIFCGVHKKAKMEQNRGNNWNWRQRKMQRPGKYKSLEKKREEDAILLKEVLRIMSLVVERAKQEYGSEIHSNSNVVVLCNVSIECDAFEDGYYISMMDNRTFNLLFSARINNNETKIIEVILGLLPTYVNW
jgi:hypothetical protein